MTDSRKALREQGLKIRTEVLGKKYVEAALNNVTPFNAGLQELLNEYCWGAGWGSEGLTRRERSLINLAMLTALGRTHEVAVHVRGAKNNGLTNEQIAAVFLQTAIYCGVPAAVDSFRAANPIIAEWDAEHKGQAAAKPAAATANTNGNKTGTANDKKSSAKPLNNKTSQNVPQPVSKPAGATAGKKPGKSNAAFPIMKPAKK
jgi:4-carboxymuconolactone decarboxylase